MKRSSQSSIVDWINKKKVPHGGGAASSELSSSDGDLALQAKG